MAVHNLSLRNFTFAAKRNRNPDSSRSLKPHQYLFTIGPHAETSRVCAENNTLKSVKNIMMLYRVAVVCCLALVLSVAAAAQDLAELIVTVVDPTAAMVPGAKVTIIDVHRGFVREAQTREDGYVDFDSLNPGDYSLDVVKAGFNRYRIDRVTLNIRAREAVHVALSLSAAAGVAVDVVASVDILSSDPAQGVALEQS